jgi:Zn-finger nucleic acid-binding protein
MNCPVDGAELRPQIREGVEVNGCKECAGIWLDRAELDLVEDPHFSQDDFKGSLVTEKKPSTFSCPVCGTNMYEFDYRYNDLHLDLCPKKCGWWLDSGEVERVELAMEERKRSLERVEEVEREWAEQISALRSPSYIDNVWDAFDNTMDKVDAWVAEGDKK